MTEPIHCCSCWCLSACCPAIRRVCSAYSSRATWSSITSRFSLFAASILAISPSTRSSSARTSSGCSYVHAECDVLCAVLRIFSPSCFSDKISALSMLALDRSNASNMLSSCLASSELDTLSRADRYLSFCSHQPVISDAESEWFLTHKQICSFRVSRARWSEVIALTWSSTFNSSLHCCRSFDSGIVMESDCENAQDEYVPAYLRLTHC